MPSKKSVQPKNLILPEMQTKNSGLQITKRPAAENPSTLLYPQKIRIRRLKS
jgi:hypothetical protein